MNWNTIRGKIIGNNQSEFIKNYCSPVTVHRLSGYSDISYFRTLISTLSEILPDAPHDTPGWREGPYPVIVIGSAQNVELGLRVMRPRFGLCLEENDLKLWSDGKLCSALKATTKGAEWAKWRQGEYFRGNALQLLQKQEVGDILKSFVHNAEVTIFSVGQPDHCFDIPLLYPLVIHMANRAENYRRKGGFGL